MNLIMPPGFITAATEAEWRARLDAVFGRDLADQEPIAMPQLQAMSRYHGTPSLAALAGVPTLVLSGAHDLIAHALLARALAQAIPGARHIAYPDAAHALPMQCADAVNEILLSTSARERAFAAATKSSARACVRLPTWRARS
jgi:3-oxoadipate enol-lactonase